MDSNMPPRPFLQSNCDEFQDSSESSASAIGIVIIFFNCVYLVYFGLGLLYHGYFVLIPPKLRCGKAEKALADLHAKIPENMSKAVYPNHHHKLIDHHNDPKYAEARANKAQTQLDDNEAVIAKKLDSEKSAAKQKLEERKRKKAAKKAAKQGAAEAAVANVEGKNADQITVEIEMPEREMSEHTAEGKSHKK